jgi:hypothetical protein
MTDKSFSYEIKIKKLFRPIGGEYRYAAKVVYMRSPDGKILWKEYGLIGEVLGRDKDEADGRARKAAAAWINQQEGKAQS